MIQEVVNGKSEEVGRLTCSGTRWECRNPVCEFGEDVEERKTCIGSKTTTTWGMKDKTLKRMIVKEVTLPFGSFS